jgi:hypothetical protein
MDDVVLVRLTVYADLEPSDEGIGGSDSGTLCPLSTHSGRSRPIADIRPVGGPLDMRRTPRRLLSHNLAEWGHPRKTPCKAQS